MTYRALMGVLLLLVICVSSVPAFAQSPESANTISAIRIEGNQRTNPDTIKAFLNLSEGDAIDPEKLDDAFKQLFATGLFADARVELEGDVLLVRVVENPIINEVAFEGNKRIEDEALASEIKLAPREVFTKTVLQNDLKRILDIYQKSGRFSAIVEPKVIQLEQNRVNLVFEIEEGERTKIAQVSFVGNENFSDKTLTNIVNTKETVWYRFFSSDDTYDPDRLAFDQELLRRFYVARGYADFRVVSAIAELTPERDAFFITFTLEEGDQYNFGNMTVESELEELRGETLSELLLTNSGEVFNAEQVEASVEAITKHLGNLGYAFVKIDPQYDQNNEDDVIGVNYLIREGPRVYVEQININGNVRTLDKVVRREFRVAEGDPYNAAKINRSKQRINNLGFFNKVDVNNVPGSAEDRVNIDVEVEERSTGELTLGAGFSTADGALGDISIVERNLLGKGQRLKLNFTLSAARQQFDVGFTEPYFLDRNVSAGFDIFKTKRDGSSSLTNRSFDSDAVGGTLRTSYPIVEHLTHSVRYTLRSDEITDIDEDASRFIRDQEGKTTISMVGHSLMYDRRDNRFDPREGYFLRLNQDVAGLGGDSQFVRNEVRGGYFLPTINKDWILQLQAKSGYILGYGGRDVEINNRFFIGSNDIRGFETDGIGPRDTLTDDALGGNSYYAGTLELSFPIAVAEELGFTGAVFTDAGSLFDVDDDGAEVADTTALRMSAGAGIAWTSPLGPIRIDFAHAFLKEDFDETEIVRFSFGTRF